MISVALEEEDPGSMPEIFATSEEEEPGSMLGICNGATTEEEGGGLGFHTQDLQPVPRGAEVGGEERSLLVDMIVVFLNWEVDQKNFR
jgi:hypothetical protein